jgi:aminoglycoside phosphotransferase family enzyme/predicted kinase
MPQLIAALQDPRRYPHPVDAVRVIETHISWVLLTGSFAYKIKKPVRLDFADFSTLELRRVYCMEELRLNRRLAPQLYLEVVPITGSPTEPCIDGTGSAFEYALKMREFPQENLLAEKIAHGTLLPAHIDAIADTCVYFHEQICAANPPDEFASTDALLENALDNFAAIERLLSGNGMHLRIAALKRWTRDEHARLGEDFARRRDGRRIRECHGDLHLGNIALVDGAPAIFDCIEFNAAFRWIDVMNEIAFIAMDLAARARPDFAYRLLNRYLEGCGDYAGLGVLRFYLVYRAMVRAKIDCIRARQSDLPQGADTRAWQDFVTRVTLAEQFTEHCPRLLVITFGLSASGKSTAAQHAAECCQLIRIRSDSERKRLFGLRPGDSSHSPVGGGIYTQAVSEQVYDRLEELAKACIEAGHPVVIDAAFLRRAARNRFRTLAQALGAKFAIIHCDAAETDLRARIEHRQGLGSDASEAGIDVLETQKQFAEDLDAAELASAISVDTADPTSMTRMVHALNAAIGR